MNQEEIFHAIANRTLEENKAIKLLFTLYYPHAKRIGYRHGLSLEEIQSIFQDSIIEIFIRISQNSFTIMGVDSFKRFILKVVKNKCLSESRKNSKLKHELPFNLVSEEREFDLEEFHPKLIERIFELASKKSKKSKEIIYRRFYLKERYDVIAQKMGYSNENSVKNALHRIFLYIRSNVNLKEFIEN